MKQSIGWVILWAALLTSATAQRDPHIGYVYPAGGRQGTTFQVTMGGQALSGVTNVFVSGAGVSGVILKHERQLTPPEQKEAMEKAEQFRTMREQGKRLTADEWKQAIEVRDKLIHFGRRLVNPGLNEFVTLQFTIAPDAPVGKREVRLKTIIGLSNPLTFCVDRLPESSKKDWKNIPKARFSMDPELDPSPNEMRTTLPIILNGQIQPGGVDRYRFTAKQGQPLTVIVSARELIPYMADAVPGWIQAKLTLYDGQGKELAVRDDYQFRPDPVLFYTIPRDGEYVLEIRDALYRGREDFVYRITMGEFTFVTGVFPLGGRSGTQTPVSVAGWNLTTSATMIDLGQRAAGTYPFSIGGAVNRVPFAVDTLSEIVEAATNIQAVTLPVMINGHIDPPGDTDVFRFTGRAGEKIVAEVRARRLDSPLDSTLLLVDAAGKQLAFNDDHEDKGSGLNTHHADSYLTATLPADGTYFVHLADAQGKGSAAHAYRLRLSAPRPDFELRVTPSSLSVRGGASAPLTVYALRHDGFAGEIALALKDVPAGFALAAARIPANEDKVKITVTPPPVSTTEPVSLRIEGRAKIQGQDVVRPAVPAEDVTQAFAYRHLVPSQELKVAVWGRYLPRVAAEILTATPVRIPAGGTARVAVGLPTMPQMGKLEFELDEPPEGLTIKEFTVQPYRKEFVLQADAGTIRPGLKGNLIIKAFVDRASQVATNAPLANRPRVQLGALPAIPFEIVEK